MTHLWYAGFGSNLAYARFTAYLTGGAPDISTTSAEERGARDATPPTDFDVMEVPHKLFFAHTSAKWSGGGVAFLDPTPSAEHTTRCRLYRITVEQLADVHAQEAGQARPATIDVDEVVSAGFVDYFDALYGRLLHLGRHDNGEPIITITTPRAHIERNEPHASYLRTIALGLAEAFDMAPDDIASYLSQAIADAA